MRYYRLNILFSLSKQEVFRDHISLIYSIEGHLLNGVILCKLIHGISLWFLLTVLIRQLWKSLVITIIITFVTILIKNYSILPSFSKLFPSISCIFSRVICITLWWRRQLYRWTITITIFVFVLIIWWFHYFVIWLDR